MMNIVHICTSDLRHGAGVAAYRLHKALKKKGVYSTLIVAQKFSKDEDVLSAKPEPVNLLSRAYRWGHYGLELTLNLLGPQNVYSYLSQGIENHPAIRQADVIHLHNIHWPFRNFSLNLLKIGKAKPLFWTFHDMWPITGHCYHSFECQKWMAGCKGGCPYLLTFIPLAWDSCPMQWEIKKKIYAGTSFHVVAPSLWLTQLAQRSPLLTGHPVTCIPNIVDTANFRILNKDSLRRSYGFSEREKLILFVAANINIPLKGLNCLLDVLINLNHPIVVIVAGKGKIPARYSKRLRIYHFGKLNEDHKLCELYNLADITILPSLAENLSNVMGESMACGTPVVGSRVGGIPDMIDHQINGFLFPPGDSSLLAKGINYFLSNDEARINAGQEARKKIEKFFSVEAVVSAHLDLYTKFLNIRVQNSA